VWEERVGVCTEQWAMTERERAAYRAAGQAAMAHVLGHTVDRVTIYKPRKSPRTLYETAHSRPAGAPVSCTVEAVEAGLYTMASIVAEYLGSIGIDPEPALKISSGDCTRLQLAERAPDGCGVPSTQEAGALSDWLIWRTLRVLRARWVFVRLIALELLLKRVLVQADIERLAEETATLWRLDREFAPPPTTSSAWRQPLPLHAARSPRGSDRPSPSSG